MQGDSVFIPIRNSASVGQVVSALRTLAASTELQDSGSHDSEVARVLDDTYVPVTEEEYIATQPTYEELEEEKEKNKKWWNPFD